MYVAHSVLKIWQTVTGSINQVINLDTLQTTFAYNHKKKVKSQHEVYHGEIRHSPISVFLRPLSLLLKSFVNSKVQKSCKIMENSS